MPVNAEHPQYTEKKDEWQRNNDCDAGDIAIKKGKDKYLPMPEKDNEERYKDFLTSALFTNYTGTKRRDLVGKVFRRPPVVTLPPELEYIKQKADNGNVTLETMGQRAVGNVWLNGRYALVATFPDIEMPLNEDGNPVALTAEQSEGLQAYIATYPALSVRNWRDVNGQLTMVVLHEIDYDMTDEFTRTAINMFRVYRLVESDGRKRVTFQVYRETTALGDPKEIIFNGVPAEEIPVVLVGSEDNNPDCDFAPASDICANNIADYQMFAICAENGFVGGQGTMHIDSGLTNAADFSAANPMIKVGNRNAIITQGGNAEIFTQKENTIARALTQDIKNTLYDLGVNSGGAQKGTETAEAAIIRAASDAAVMNVIAQNVSDGFTQVLKWCAMFMGGDPDKVEFELNRNFFPVRLDPQLLQQLSSLAALGDIPRQVIYNYLRESSDLLNGIDDETLGVMIEHQPPI